MRVLIDTTYALRGPSGTAVYLERLIAALRAAGVEVIEAANERRSPPAGGGLGSVRNLLADRRWARRELSRRARDAGADVVHHPLPAFTARTPCPQVVTVHDLAFATHPEHFSRGFGAWARLAHRRAAVSADAVICVSQATADLVMEWWGVPRERIVVAHHGPGQELPAVAPREPEHVLYVGDDEPRKNLGLLLAAAERFTALPVRIAGRAGESVDAAALANLYAGALALVHPSVDEGFGLVPLEAMAAGVPVVAVRTAAVEEVCGEAALYVAGDDPAGLAAVLERLRSGPDLRADLVARGRERAARFDWSASARAHLEAYERAFARY
jgi:glycosyltransferase involved in cell wall biosynthesis